MNIHVPQNLESTVELIELASVNKNLISSQASKPNIVIVQDSLLAAFMMTYNYQFINKSDFYNIAMHLSDSPFILNKIKHIQLINKKFKKFYHFNKFSGKDLFSLLLPLSFHY